MVECLKLSTFYMRSATVTLYSERDTLPFVINCTTDTNSLLDYLLECLKLSLCGEEINDGIVNFQFVHKNHIDNIERLKKYLARDLPELKLPKLNAIVPWLTKTGEGKFFAVCFNRIPSTEEAIAIHAKIEELNGGEKMENILSQTQEIAGDIMANYKIVSSIPDKRTIYGQEQVGKRVCRYCHRPEPEVLFKKVAHTISEGLGNKFTITYNECDECNEYFGNTCEPELIAYLDIMRPFFRIKGKNGEIDKIEGENFKIVNDASDGKTLKIDVMQTSYNPYPIKEKDGLILLDLNHNKKIIPQNIYKALVKFSYGIVPNKYLNKFGFTADWLLGKETIDKLPLVMESINNTYTQYPRVVTYIRNNDRGDLPFAIGEFWAMNSIFVYIIPVDKENSFMETEWEELKKTFRNYKSVKWHYKNFSSAIPQQMKFHLNFEQRTSH